MSEDQKQKLETQLLGIAGFCDELEIEMKTDNKDARSFYEGHRFM